MNYFLDYSPFTIQGYLLKNKYDKCFIKDQTGKSSFSEIFINSSDLAKNIFSQNGKNKRYLIPAYHNTFFVESLLAVILSGNIAIPVDPDLTGEHLKKITKKFKIDFIFDKPFPASENQADMLPEIKPDDSVLALLTSGSTGEPKAVVSTIRNILSNAFSVITTMQLENPGKVAIILPLYHSFALVTQLITTLITGGQIFMTPDFKFPGELIDFIVENQIETIAGVPTNFKMLLMGNGIKFESVKHITVAGAALDPVFADNMKNSFPNAKIWVGYGLTEAGPRVTAINDSEPEFKLGSVGRPIDKVDIKIKNNEVLVKGPSIMKGYLDDQKTTYRKIINEWLYTSDLGKIDENGYLYIIGRKDDVFNSGGEKISPLTIERVLNKHPAIHFSAVYGETDPVLGNKIIALIQTEENVSLLPKDLLIYCKKHLENYLIPHKFMKVKSLPLTSNGKLQRKELPLCQKKKL
jgi:long-chain acyl-CoA synthetase